MFANVQVNVLRTRPVPLGPLSGICWGTWRDVVGGDARTTEETSEQLVGPLVHRVEARHRDLHVDEILGRQTEDGSRADVVDAEGQRIVELVAKPLGDVDEARSPRWVVLSDDESLVGRPHLPMLAPRRRPMGLAASDTISTVPVVAGGVGSHRSTAPSARLTLRDPAPTCRLVRQSARSAPGSPLGAKPAPIVQIDVASDATTRHYARRSISYGSPSTRNTRWSRRSEAVTCPMARLGEVVTIRPASAADIDFLQRMLLIAADWRPDSTSRPMERMLTDPALAHYVVGWPRAGDFGVIGEDDQRQPVGAAWRRLFAADDPGYGFVAPDVPEVSIGVLAQARSRGVGRSLMAGLIAEARRRNIHQLSLSVEVDNYATQLYASLGFRPAREVDGSVTMVLDLT